MKRYSIYGVSGSESPQTYHGTFEPVSGQHDIITALAAEFADGDIDDLIAWLGGSTPLAEIEACDHEFELRNDDAVFHVMIHDAPVSEH